MSKVTTEGWPDPSDWANRLHQRLEAIGEDYFSASWEVAADPEQFEGLNLKQARAAEALIAIHSALREMPLFAKSSGAAILHDVAGALRDVVMGGKPRLLTAVRPGKAGTDGIARNYLRVWAVLTVRFLVEGHNLTETKARAIVASIFAKAGATGRKGKPLSASTLRSWCERTEPHSKNPDDVRVNAEIESRLNSYRADPNWPGRYEDTIDWIEKIAADPLLSSKYG